MAWQEDTKILIEDLLTDMQTPNFPVGYLSGIESSLKTSLELGAETIDKIQELDLSDADHENRLQLLENGYPLPQKIWEGSWSSGSLTPNSDAGHVSGAGDLTDYNILVFVCHEVNGSDEDNSVHWMPQALWSFFNSEDKINRLTVGSHRLKAFFSDEETLSTTDGSNDVEIVEIWGIK